MASRKNTEDLVANPAKKFLQWGNIQTIKVVDGEEFKKITGGEFRYYDKELVNEETGKGTNVSISTPFEFAILNSDCYNWKGNDKNKNNRYTWTNEVNEYTKVVKLQCKEGDLVSNLFEFKVEDYKNKFKKEEIKEKLKGFGVDYCQSVYISPKTENGFTEIWNLQLKKAPLTGGNGLGTPDIEDKYDGWFGYIKQCKLQNKNILSFTTIVDSLKAKKNGDVKFFIPVYQLGNLITKEENNQLTELFNKLEEYHQSEAKRINQAIETPATVENDAD